MRHVPIVLAIFISVSLVSGLECPNTIACPTNDPITWSNENVKYVSPDLLAKNVDVTKKLWEKISDVTKEELFKINFDDFIGDNRGDTFFSNKFGKPMRGLDTAKGVTFDGQKLSIPALGIDASKTPFIDVVSIGNNNIEEVIATENGFVIKYTKGQIKIQSGTINKDGTLSDGSVIEFSNPEQEAVVDKEGHITLKKGTRLRDNRGNEITADQDGTIVKNVGTQFLVEGKSHIKLTLSNGEIADIDSRKNFAYDTNGNFIGDHAKLTIQKDNKNLQVVDGKFRKIGNSFSIESYDGKQSYFESDGVTVKSVGYPLVIGAENAEKPAEFSAINNMVLLSKEGISLQGAAEIIKDTFHITSKNPNSVFTLKNEEMYGKGKITIEDSDMRYEGVTDSSEFTSKTKGKNQLISIKGKENGEIAKLSKKIKIGDFSNKDGFVSKEIEIKSTVIKEGGNTKIELDKNSVLGLAEISKDPSKVTLINKNMVVELGDKKTYFSINSETGIRYEPLNGNPVNFLGASKTHEYLGNDLDTVKLMIKKQSKGEFDFQLQGLKKIFQLEKLSLMKGNNDFGASIKSFEATKNFIEKTYTDDLMKNTALTSFMIHSLGDIKANSQTQKTQYDSFVRATLKDVKKNLDSNQFLQYGDNIKSLTSFLGKSAAVSTNPQHVKELFTQQFQDKIIYEGLAERYGLGGDKTAVVRSYRALMSLEDTTVSGDRNNLQVHVDSKTFSTRKLHLAEALAFEYAKQDKLASAFAVINQVQGDFESYKQRLSTSVDPDTLTNGQISRAIAGIAQKLDTDRRSLEINGFKKIIAGLSLQSDKIQQVEESRKGYGTRIGEKWDSASVLERTALVSLSGGFGKDFINLVGGFDSVKHATATLGQENQIFARGTYGLYSLRNAGLSGKSIESWLNDDLFDIEAFTNQILVSSGRAKANIDEPVEIKGVTNDGKIITWVNNQKYAIDPHDQKIVVDFLKDVKAQSKQTYYSKEYGKDIRRLIGTESLLYKPGEYITQDALDLDSNFQREKFEQRITALKLDSSILNFVDEGLSPLSISIGAITGGIGGTSFSSAKGISGALGGVAENVVIDAATGTILVHGYDLDLSEHPYLAMGTAIGVGIATGIPRTLKALSDASFDLNRYAKRLATTTNIEERTLKEVLQGVDLTDSHQVVNALRNANLKVNALDVRTALTELESTHQAVTKLRKAGTDMESTLAELNPRNTNSQTLLPIGVTPSEGSIRFKTKIENINTRIKNNDVDASLRTTVTELYRLDPKKTAALIDGDFLSELNLGGRADFFKNLQRTDAKEQLLSVADRSGISFTRNPAGDIVIPTTNVQYIGGRYGIILENENGFKKVVYHDGQNFKIVHLDDNDMQTLGGLSTEDSTRLYNNWVTERSQGLESGGLKPRDDWVKEKQAFSEKVIKRVTESPTTSFTKRIGLSDEVAEVGRGIRKASEIIPEPVALSNGDRVLVREFTTDDGKRFKYPVKKYNPNTETWEPILYETKLYDGTRAYSTENVDLVSKGRLPNAVTKANLEGRVTYIMEGSKEDIAGFLAERGFDLKTVQSFELTPINQGTAVSHRLYYAKDGQRDIVILGGMKGSSKQQRLEDLAVLSGQNPEKIGVIKSAQIEKDYTQSFSSVLKTEKPDMVIMGDSGQFEEIIRARGGYSYSVQAKLRNSDETLGGMKVFKFKDPTGKVKTILSTSTPNGKMAGYLTDAITSQERSIAVGIVGDSGTHTGFKNAFNELNPDQAVPVRNIEPHQAFTPGKSKLSDGRVVDVDNKMIKKGERTEVLTQGGTSLVVHHDTTHGNAHSTTQEGLAWMLRNSNVDTTDVEFSHVIESIERAKGQGKEVPLYALFNSEDNIGTGTPMGLGRSFNQEQKKLRDETLLASIAGKDARFLPEPSLYKANTEFIIPASEREAVIARLKNAELNGEIGNVADAERLIKGEFRYNKNVMIDFGALKIPNTNIRGKITNRVQQAVTSGEIKTAEQAETFITKEFGYSRN